MFMLSETWYILFIIVLMMPSTPLNICSLMVMKPCMVS
jgi:hypothetical protein